MTDVVEIISTDSVAVATEVITLLTEGMQGPPGIQGPAGGTQMQRPAAIDLSGHRVVLVNAQGKVDYASNDDVTHATRVVGITTGAAVTDAEASIQIYGEVIEPTWNWDVTQPVYLGATGNLTQTPPTSPAAAFSLVVGFPISSTSLFVNIREPIIIT